MTSSRLKRVMYKRPSAIRDYKRRTSRSHTIDAPHLRRDLMEVGRWPLRVALVLGVAALAFQLDWPLATKVTASNVSKDSIDPRPTSADDMRERVTVALAIALPESDLYTNGAEELGFSDPPPTNVRPPPPAHPPGSDIEPALPKLRQQSVTVKRGDSLSSIFKKLGLSQTELGRIIGSGGDAKKLTRINPGQVLEFYLDPDKALTELIYRIDETLSLHITHTRDGYQSELVRQQLDRRFASATGTIQSSLYLAGQKAGLSEKVIMQLAEIFGWDVDFALDIRAGDRFSVVYEELIKDGQKVRDGEILAAEFINQGRAIRAVRYTDEADRATYYSPDGHSMRKTFLRTPVDFARISSGFSRRRWHPVLHKFRAHKGVDYAARSGTPVKSTGDGKVISAGRKGGYGNTVAIQHGGIYTTLYGHLSRYARGIKRGKHVRQGQTIGYVGMSGLATGPHLHYEFRINGTHRNPLKVRFPEAAPIAQEYRRHFEDQTQSLVARLNLLSGPRIASTEP